MKTKTGVLACAIAICLLFSAIPFASAAGPVYNGSFNLEIVKKGFQRYSIYSQVLNERLSADTYYGTSFLDFSDGLLPVGRNLEWGFMNTSGEIVIPLEFRRVGAFSEGRAFVYSFSDRKYGFIDTTGNQVIPCEYDMVTEFHDGLAAVCKNGKWGFIDKQGKVVVPFKYDSAFSFREGLAKVLVIGRDGAYYAGIVNRAGIEVIPLIYYVDNQTDLVILPGEGFVQYDFFDSDEFWGRQAIFIDTCGTAIEYSNIGSLSDGMRSVQPLITKNKTWRQDGYLPDDDINEDAPWGFINAEGRQVIKPQYEKPEAFNDRIYGSLEPTFQDGVAKVCKDGKWGIIDPSGKELVPPQYKYMLMPKDGLAVVANDDPKNPPYLNYGVITVTGKVIVPLQYRYISAYKDGMACVTVFDKKTYHSSYGFLDNKGNVAVPIQYHGTGSDFHDGLALVRLYYEGSTYAYIDKKGNIVIPPKEGYDYYHNFVNGICLVRQNKKVALMDKRGNIISAWYDGIDLFHSGDYYGIYKDGKRGLIDKTGREVLKLSNYSDIINIVGGLANTSIDGKRGVVDLNGNFREGVEVEIFSDLSIEHFQDLETRRHEPVGTNTALRTISPIPTDGRKFGFVDNNNKLVVPYEYDQQVVFVNGVAKLCKDGKYGLVDITGKILLPCNYVRVCGIIENGYGWALGQDGEYIIFRVRQSMSKWAQEDVTRAIDNDLVPQFLQNNFNQKITRGEFAALLVQTMTARTGKSGQELIEGFPYKDFYDTQERDIKICASLGLMSGISDNIFAPDAFITRGEAAVLTARVRRYLMRSDITIKNTSSNNALLTSWMKDTIVPDSGIMNGKGSDTFSSNVYYSREQAIITMLRISELSI